MRAQRRREWLAHHPPPIDVVYKATLILLWGVVLPAVFLLAATGFERPGWQSGKFGDYCLLVFYWPHLIGIYPLAAFSAAGLTRLAMRPRKAARTRWVRYAVVTGLIVWASLLIPWWGGADETLGFGAAFTSVIIAPVVAGLATLPFAGVAYGALVLRARADGGGVGLFWLGLAAFIVSATVWPVWILVLVPAAPAAVGVYAWGAYRCFVSLRQRGSRVRLASVFIVFAWLSAFLAAWRTAIDSMLADYTTLPPNPPTNCFIATAAAKGHPWFVGADNAQTPINRQLRRLKAAEWILERTTPRLHAALRGVYNRLGPRAAELLTSRWLADAAYVGLKPCEWLARLLLAIAGVPAERVDRLYRFPRR